MKPSKTMAFDEIVISPLKPLSGQSRGMIEVGNGNAVLDAQFGSDDPDTCTNVSGGCTSGTGFCDGTTELPGCSMGC